VIVSLYFGNINVFNESGKISKTKKSTKFLGNFNPYPWISPKILLLLVILKENSSKIFLFNSISYVEKI
jgi:hypothetical protein